MANPLEVSVSAGPAAKPVVEATSEYPVQATSELPVQATSEIPVQATSEVPIQATSEVPIQATSERPVPATATAELLTDGSADPQAAHSPMSPDDQVSDKHTGLSYDPHSVPSTTPQS